MRLLTSIGRAGVWFCVILSGAYASSPAAPFVTNFSSITLVTGGGYSGWAGMKFTTGSAPITVAELGRMASAGNLRQHTVKLVNASTGADVPGGSVSLSMSGVPNGQFQYAVLASPLALAANTAYYLVSSEDLNTGEHFHYGNVTTTTAAVANNAVYWSSGWVMNGGAHTYGPVDFKYTEGGGGADTTPPSVNITSPGSGQTVSGTITITANASDNAGVAGVTFRVNGTPIGSEDTTSPYSVTLNTATLSDGSHTLTAVARDTSNLTTTSAPVTINVNNGGGGGGGGTAWVTGFSPVTLVTGGGYSGWAGTKFTTGASSITVTELARMAAPGNGQTHTVKLVSAATGADVAGGSVSVSMAGAPAGQFRYAALGSPVVLSANTAYYLVSSENLNSGDHFYYANVTTTTAAAAHNAVYWGSGWVMDGGAHAYGPVNLKYSLGGGGGTDTTPPSVNIISPASGQTVSGTITITANASDNVGVAGVTFRVDGTPIGSEDTTSPYSVTLNTATLSDGNHTLTAVARDTSNLTATSAPVTITVNNSGGGGGGGTAWVTAFSPVTLVTGGGYSGWAGTKFTTGSSSITVTELARMAAPGNGQTHTVKLVNAATGADVAGGSVTVSMAGAPTGQFRYAALSSPLVLGANTAYYIVSSENLNGGDSFYYANLTTTTAAAANNAVYWASSWVMDGGAHAYGPLSFRYTTGGGGTDTTPPSVNIISPPSGQTVSGTITITANASDNVAVAGVTFRVDGAPIGAEDTTSPYSVTLNTTTLSDGNHTLTAVARDTSNLTATSAPVSITVNNSGGGGGGGTAWVTSFSTITLVTGGGYTGWAGTKFTTGSTSTTVTELGRMAAPNNSQIHTVKLVAAATGADVAGGSVSVSMAGAPTGQFRYAALSSPLVLPANTAYYIVSSENLNGGDSFYYANLTTTTAAAANNAVYWASGWVMDGGAHAYGPLSFKYTAGGGGGADTTPPTVNITAPAPNQTVTGTITVTANASDNVGVAGVTFRVDGKPIGVEDTAAPHGTTLNTARLSNGEHFLTALARDSAGNSTVSASVRIVVSNASSGSIKVMPLGDSITYGYVNDGNLQNEEGGYRRYLWEDLVAETYSNVDFVGTLQNGIVTMDRDHEGHSGWRIDNINANITAWLASTQPVIILLMIGTNDLDQGATPATALSRLETLVDRILTDAPSAQLIVSSILGVRQNDTHPITQEAIDQFNAGIPNVVNPRAAAGKKISFADIFTSAALNRTLSSTDYAADGLHPTLQGYRKVATAWLQVLKPALAKALTQ